MLIHLPAKEDDWVRPEDIKRVRSENMGLSLYRVVVEVDGSDDLFIYPKEGELASDIVLNIVTSVNKALYEGGKAC